MILHTQAAPIYQKHKYKPQTAIKPCRILIDHLPDILPKGGVGGVWSHTCTAQKKKKENIQSPTILPYTADNSIIQIVFNSSIREGHRHTKSSKLFVSLSYDTSSIDIIQLIPTIKSVGSRAVDDIKSHTTQI